jgi:hypothetical protein
VVSNRIRVSTPQDEEAIVKLLRGAGLNPNPDSRALYWKYWRARADWSVARSFVLERGVELVAHVGVVPGACKWNTQRLSVLHMVDWAASKDALGAGLTLAKHVRALADALIAIDGNSNTQQLLPVMGFRRYGTAIGYVRVLRPLRYLTAPTGWGWKTLPKFISRALWWFTAPQPRASSWHIREITADHLENLAGALPNTRGGGVVMERSMASIQYMLECPTAAMRLYGVEDGGAMRGYFLLACAPSQVRLADYWVDSDAVDDWRNLIECAVETAARMPEVAELIVVSSDPMLSGCLEGLAFHARFKKPVQLLCQKEPEGPPSCPRVQMVESDGAYRCEHPVFWA